MKSISIVISLLSLFASLIVVAPQEPYDLDVGGEIQIYYEGESKPVKFYVGDCIQITNEAGKQVVFGVSDGAVDCNLAFNKKCEMDPKNPRPFVIAQPRTIGPYSKGAPYSFVCQSSDVDYGY